jgi:hypothetical protein
MPVNELLQRRTNEMARLVLTPGSVAVNELFDELEGQA